jgi:hypothetical protein
MLKQRQKSSCHGAVHTWPTAAVPAGMIVGTRFFGPNGRNAA